MGPVLFETYAQIFDQRAGAYHAAMRGWPRARDAEFQAVLEPLHDAPGGLVCDMPSGGGYLAEHLAAGHNYLGVDPAQTFLDACSEPLRETLNAPIDCVPLADDSVDYVVSVAGLHHEADLAPIFAEMHRLVRHGGTVILADVAVDTPPARFLNGFVDRHNPSGHDGRFLDDRTRPALAAAGLTVVDDARIEVPWAFDSPADAGAFCRDLFGLAGVGAEAIGDVLDQQIGFAPRAGGVDLLWALRRIVCAVAKPACR